jgi:polyhydroxybutyrate depolymerase
VKFARIVLAILLCAQLNSAAAAPQQLVVGGSRPVAVHLPADISEPSPLLIMLHSASTSGAHQERYMKLAPIAKKLGMIYIAPNGTVGSDGRRVWNAAKACCQRDTPKVDDIAYINSLIDEIALKVPVDKSRIYFVGHSNGAFMSIAFACATGKAAGVVSLAGAMDTDLSCATTRSFTFLQIHGDADPTIKFAGGVLNKFAYTSAEETLGRIAAINKCDQKAQPASTKKNFDPAIPGDETDVKTLSGCLKPTSLWRINGGLHSPKLPKDYAQQILTYLIQ